MRTKIPSAFCGTFVAGCILAILALPIGGERHALGYDFILRYHGNLQGDLELHPSDG